MLTLQQIEANIVFLERTTIQGAESRTFIDLMNALHAQRARLITAAQAPQVAPVEEPQSLPRANGAAEPAHV